MSNFKVDNLEVNTINGNSISSLGGSSSGTTMTEYSSINTGSIQGTDFPEVSNGDVKSKEVTITEDTQIRKMTVTTKNLDGKLTVGNTVFEGTKVDTSGKNTLTLNTIKLNMIEKTSAYVAIKIRLFDVDGNMMTGLTDNISFSDSTMYSGRELGAFDDTNPGAGSAKSEAICGDAADSANITYTFNTPLEVSKIVVISNGYYSNYNTGTWEISINDTVQEKIAIINPDATEDNIYFGGPSIPTITKEIQLDSTTIDMELDGTLDSVDYETFSGQDIDIMSIMMTALAGSDTDKASALTKIQKLL